MVRSVCPFRCAAFALAMAALQAGSALWADTASQFFADNLDLRGGWDVELDGAVDAAAQPASGGAGEIGLRSATVSAVRSFALGNGLAVQGGVRVTEVILTAPAAALLPAGLRSNGLVTGLIWKPAPTVGLSVQALPAFSGAGAGSAARTLNVSGVAAGFWQVSSHVVLEAGLEFDSLGKYTLYPAGGVVVDVARDWSLRLLFPQPRLVWRATAGWSLFVGADVEVQSFRMDPHFGEDHGIPRLDNAPLTLEETQFGPGAGYQFGEAFYLELNVGAVTDRHFDYFRAGQEVAPRDALAARLSLELTF